jgi:hypothetical protein
MRIQLASDLHLELLRRWPHECLITPAPGAELLVLAGDIHRGPRAIERFALWPVPVLYLAGNHEYYDSQWEPLRSDLRLAADGTAVRFLDNDVFTLDGVRFLGSTLWTDYTLSGIPLPEAMEAAEGFLLDHRRILTGSGPFRAAARGWRANCRSTTRRRRWSSPTMPRIQVRFTLGSPAARSTVHSSAI